jgi:hypothetical protein
MIVRREADVNLDLRLIHDRVAGLICRSEGVEQHHLIEEYSKMLGVTDRTAKSHLKLLTEVYLPNTPDAEIGFRKSGVTRGSRVTWFLLRAPIAQAMGMAADMQEAAGVMTISEHDREFAHRFGLSDDELAAYKSIVSTGQFGAGSAACPNCHLRTEVPIARFGLLEIGACPQCFDAFIMPPRWEYLNRSVRYRDVWTLLHQEAFIESVRRMLSLEKYQAKDRKAHRGLGRLKWTNRPPRRAGRNKKGV